MFREMRTPWLVRTSLLHFHKARALRHTSALLRYNPRSLRHRYERAQFTIYFIKEIKRPCSSSIILSYISTWEFLRTLEKCEKHSPLARASPYFSRVRKNSRVLIVLNNALGPFFISLVQRDVFSCSSLFLLNIWEWQIDVKLSFVMWRVHSLTAPEVYELESPEGKTMDYNFSSLWLDITLERYDSFLFGFS